jgi:hypothetical protein
MKRDPKHGGEQAESYKMAGGYAYVRKDTYKAIKLIWVGVIWPKRTSKPANIEIYEKHTSNDQSPYPGEGTCSSSGSRSRDE